MPLGGRSRTWPILAFTTNPSPRYLLIVLAFAGDSTITRSFPLDFFFAMLCRLLRPKDDAGRFPALLGRYRPWRTGYLISHPPTEGRAVSSARQMRSSPNRDKTAL